MNEISAAEFCSQENDTWIEQFLMSPTIHMLQDNLDLVLKALEAFLMLSISEVNIMGLYMYVCHTLC
jgi:hypothetical protein